MSKPNRRKESTSPSPPAVASYARQGRSTADPLSATSLRIIPGNGQVVTKDNAHYEPHLFYDDAMAGLQDCSLLAGTLRVNKLNKHEAYVTIPGLDRDLYIDGASHQNRAVDGDTVVLQVLPQAKWRINKMSRVTASSGRSCSSNPDQFVDALEALWNPKVRASPAASHEVDVAASSEGGVKLLQHHIDAVQARLVGSKVQPTAKVVHILERVDEAYVGVVRVAKEAALFDAFDDRLPRGIRIRASEMPKEYRRNPETFAASMLCLVKLRDWAVGYKSPTVPFAVFRRIVEVAGSASVDSDILSLLKTNSLLRHMEPFSSEIVDSLPSATDWHIPDEELARRRDLRDWTIFSIDPSTARDLDDAMSIRALDNDTFEIGVHIADVSHFIQPGSPLDVEAQARCTSVYFVNQVLPMLPRVLCEHLCSLNASVDRLAFTVLWHMHKDGSLVRDAPIWFGKTIIRSCCQLDYGTAQTILDERIDEAAWRREPTGGHSKTTIATCIRQLGEIARARRRQRFATGTVQLHQPKLSFELDDNGNPVAMTEYPIRESNHLVEEYMLLANYLVAQHLLQHGPPVLLRNHAAPDREKWSNALATLEKLNVHVDLSTQLLTPFLEQLELERGSIVLQTVRHMLIKPMATAEYVVVDDALAEHHRHFALNVPYYTHFTSPIRRYQYADVLVHRLLEASLTTGSTAAVCVARSVVTQCNVQKARSKKAQKLCDLVFLTRYVQHKGELDTTGVVVGIGSRSFTLVLIEFGFEQRLNALDVATRYRFNDVEPSLKLTLKSGTTVTLEMFQPVQARLTTTKALPLKLVYTLVAPSSS
ncbi:hypothetical protein DYB32_008985 [Aphanomyces invadans]|uniref:RNB domain-containing protein n=1 Tax=Aphanomyces invadans TaxID=157072 RepID=A0A418AJM0_9STRA|nr:hypothetical protein DYB32_008985 [Aphanomyces invadans]